jgi:hypothetical protein
MGVDTTKGSIDRDMRRRQLAHRLVIRKARTKTILHLTGLSRHQMATLRQRWRIGDEMRHRGPSPTLSVLLSTSRVRAQAAALAIFWKVLQRYENPKGFGSEAPVPVIQLGERLCDVFDWYLACFPETELELEHLIVLARGLEDPNSIALTRCSNCNAAMLIDRLAVQRRLCSHCHASDVRPQLQNISDATSEETASPSNNEEDRQLELF